jgi:hypothetical protein
MPEYLVTARRGLVVEGESVIAESPDHAAAEFARRDPDRVVLDVARIMPGQFALGVPVYATRYAGRPSGGLVDDDVEELLDETKH